MDKHPFYSLFHTLKKQKTKGAASLSPIPSEKIQTRPPRCFESEKMGVLILAGGEGTRLGTQGPKGCTPLSHLEKKTLFEHLFEKIRAKKKALFVALMTSPLNHEETVKYLKKNHYFGIDPHTLSIFQQGMVEVSDENGYLLYEEEQKRMKAPDGNGRALYHLYHSKTLEKWEKAGVEVVQVLPIDNPLAKPFDTEFLGVHKAKGVELVLKCIKREDPEEEMGIVGMEGECLTIWEYSELPPPIKKKRGIGMLGNTALFSCTTDFIKRVHTLPLPWHLAQKRRKLVAEFQGGTVWKFETFIFDLFPHAKSFQIILDTRENCFAPLKYANKPIKPLMEH